MEETDVRDIAERMDDALAEGETDPDVLGSLIDEATETMRRLEDEATALHRSIDRALEAHPADVGRLTRELRDRYRRLDALRSGARHVSARLGAARLRWLR